LTKPIDPKRLREEIQRWIGPSATTAKAP